MWTGHQCKFTFSISFTGLIIEGISALRTYAVVLGKQSDARDLRIKFFCFTRLDGWPSSRLALLATALETTMVLLLVARLLESSRHLFKTCE